MALIKCPECEREVSSNAEKCPNCGYPLTQIHANTIKINGVDVDMDSIWQQTKKEDKMVSTIKKMTKAKKGEVAKIVNDYLKQKGIKKPESTLGTVSAILALFTCTSPIAFILALVDLIKNNKSEKHTGSWFAIIYFIIAFLVFTSSYGNKEENTVIDTTDGTTQQIQVEKTSEEIKSEEPSTEEKLKKGQSFEKDGLKVTIDDVNTDYTDYDKNWFSPDEGKKYIKVSFTYENTSDSGDKYVSIYDFECYADNALCEQSYNFGGDFINANLSKGRNVSFSTYYVVPIDASTIELEYSANIWTGEKVVVKVQ